MSHISYHSVAWRKRALDIGENLSHGGTLVITRPGEATASISRDSFLVSDSGWSPGVRIHPRRNTRRCELRWTPAPPSIDRRLGTFRFDEFFLLELGGH